MTRPLRALTRLAPRWLVGVTATLAGAGAFAQAKPTTTPLPGPLATEAPAVSLNGVVGSRMAILVVAGQTHTVAVGAQAAGVRLVALEGDTATVEAGGRRLKLTLGESPASVTDPRGGVSAGVVSGRDLTLVADGAGHFIEPCQLEDRAARCLVDTGATLVTLSQQQADRLGIRYAEGERVQAQTANGAVTGWRITLRKIRLSTVEIPQVEAVVLPGALEHVLLGNSFLRHFQFSRQDNLLRLQRSP